MIYRHASRLIKNPNIVLIKQKCKYSSIINKKKKKKVEFSHVVDKSG